MGICFGTGVSRTRDEERVQDIKHIYNNLVSQYCQLHEDYLKVKEELNRKIEETKQIEDDLSQIKVSYMHMRQVKSKVERHNQVLNYKMRYML